MLNMKRFSKKYFWLIAIVLFFISWILLNPGSGNIKSVTYTEFLVAVDTNSVNDFKIKSVSIEGNVYNITLQHSRTGTILKQKTIGPKKIEYELIKKLKDNKIDLKFTSESSNGQLLYVVISLLPILLIFGLIYFFMRQFKNASSGGAAGGMQFGKSPARMLTKDEVDITFDDVAGIDEARDEVEEIIEFLKYPAKFTKLGSRIPKGVLLTGPPGTGKTILAKAIAGEAGVPFFSISGSDFVEMFVGVGASRVRDLFEQAKAHAPCIIFIDEIDAVGRQRGAGIGGGHDEREQTLNQLLVEMDGFESSLGVIVVAATNRSDVLDSAMMRPGRFDRHIIVDKPDINGRHEILKIHAKRVPLGEDVNLRLIARGTPGFVGADLENLVNEASLIAARFNKDFCEMIHFELAKDKVLMGRERKSMLISPKEKEITAWHESGHALVARLLKDTTDPVHKVTIIPRGRALGVTQQLPEKDQLSVSKVYANSRIVVLMGGRAAEEINFGHYTTGASNDIHQATELAYRMVTEFGMSEKLGPVKYSSSNNSVFLGRDISSRQKTHSEKTLQIIDEEVKRIVSEGYEKAVDLLNKNSELLKTMSEILLERETIDAEDIEAIMAGTQLPDKKAVSIPTFVQQRKAEAIKARDKSIFSAPKKESEEQ